jgi:ABC-2 type transport system permease protein
LQSLSIQNLGINEHYQSISRGVLDTRDLAYFIVLTGLFIGLTLFTLLLQRQKSLKDQTLFKLISTLVIITIIAAFTFTRFDFTAEKRYTISPISLNLLDSLPNPVKVTVYLQGDLTGGMKRLQRATSDMLIDLRSYSHNKIEIEFIDPLEGLATSEQDQVIQDLQAKGLEPTNLSVQTEKGLSQKVIFPWAAVSSNGHVVLVKLLNAQTQMSLTADEQLNNSIQNLEYAFTSAIKKATGNGIEAIGFSIGHNELDDRQLNGAIQSLSDGFIVGRVDLKSIPFDSLAKIKLVVVAKPDKPFTEDEKFKLDQYIMRGGRVVWAIDQVSAELDSLRGHGGQQLAFNKQLNLDDQLFGYGVRINYDLIADINCAQIPMSTGNMGGQSQIQLVPWLYYPVLITLPQQKQPIVKNLDGIYSQFASTIDVLSAKNIKATTLLASSPYNKNVAAPFEISLQSIEQAPNPKEFQSDPKTIGVLLEGKFKSDFKNRPIPIGITDKVEHLDESVPTKMIVISDGDIFKNQVGGDGSPYPLGYDRYTQQTYANKNLLLNIADYLTDDSGLIELRTKEIKLRLLDKALVRSEKLYWQVINTVLPLLLVLIFAIFQHYARRRKYAR